ncbi:36294_t:CDS:1, partial [Racocetra persica]
MSDCFDWTLDVQNVGLDVQSKGDIDWTSNPKVDVWIERSIQ